MTILQRSSNIYKFGKNFFDLENISINSASCPKIETFFHVRPNIQQACHSWQLANIQGELHLAKRHPANALDYDILRMRNIPWQQGKVSAALDTADHAGI